MKILQINAVSGIRSTGRSCIELANYLSKNGHEAYIAYSEGLFFKNGFRIGGYLDRKIHALFSRISGKQAYFSNHKTHELLNWMDEIKPDVVHLGNLHGNFINLRNLLNYLAENDIPTVITLHDCWFFTGKCSHYTLDRCFRWKEKCGCCPRLKKDNKSWFFDKTTELLSDKKVWFENIPRLAIVGVSDWITNEAKQSILSSASIVTRIYNWIDLSLFSPIYVEDLRKKLCLENKFVVLGVASGWDLAKGLDKFIELSKIIPEDMVILLIGHLNIKIDMPNNIIHFEETHDINELVVYYSLADVFVNFSLEESFGKVVAEALACGTPVITNNSTANPELIGDGCGYIINNYNLVEIAKYVELIEKNGKGFYTKNCIDFAKSMFSNADRMRDYERLYEEILEK